MPRLQADDDDEDDDDCENGLLCPLSLSLRPLCLCLSLTYRPKKQPKLNSELEQLQGASLRAWVLEPRVASGGFRSSGPGLQS